MTGGLSLIFRNPSTIAVSFGITASEVCERDFFCFFANRAEMPGSFRKYSLMASMVTCAYQVSSTLISANSAIRSRYDAAAARTASSAAVLEKLRSRAARMRLAPSRFTSHSHWTREGLIEVVDVENQHSFGRGKAAKVRQVAIAAYLNGDPRHAR